MSGSTVVDTPSHTTASTRPSSVTAMAKASSLRWWRLPRSVTAATPSAVASMWSRAAGCFIPQTPQYPSTTSTAAAPHDGQGSAANPRSVGSERPSSRTSGSSAAGRGGGPTVGGRSAPQASQKTSPAANASPHAGHTSAGAGAGALPAANW